MKQTTFVFRDRHQLRKITNCYDFLEMAAQPGAFGLLGV
jgi:hypothetical protein